MRAEEPRRPPRKGQTIESGPSAASRFKPRPEESAAGVRDTEVVLLATKPTTTTPQFDRETAPGSGRARGLRLSCRTASRVLCAARPWRGRVMAGPTYVATALVEPGRIVRPGPPADRVPAKSHITNEVPRGRPPCTRRSSGADIVSEPHADGASPSAEVRVSRPVRGVHRRGPSAHRPLWADPGTRESFLAASREMHPSRRRRV